MKVKMKNARLSEESANKFYKVEVETEEDLEKLSEWLDSYIIEYRGHDAVIDVRDRLLLYKI